MLGRGQVTESQVASNGPPVAPSYPASLPSPGWDLSPATLHHVLVSGMSPITWLQGPWAARLGPLAPSLGCLLCSLLPLPQVSVSLLCAPDLSSLRLPARLEPSWWGVVHFVSLISQFPQAEVGSHQARGGSLQACCSCGQNPGVGWG